MTTTTIDGVTSVSISVRNGNTIIEINGIDFCAGFELVLTDFADGVVVESDVIVAIETDDYDNIIINPEENIEPETMREFMERE